MNKEKLTLLIGGEEIGRRVAELAERISADYEGKQLLLVCVLKGAVIFASDLMRRLKSTSGDRFYCRLQLRLRHRLLGGGAHT